MKRNPLIPFALIAVLGIIIMFVFSFQGLHKSKELAEAKKNGGKTTQTAAKPEEIVKQSCTSCHGDQLQGAVGPNLQKVGGKLSKDQIQEVIVKGRGNMPPGLIPADQASKVADWLSKKK
ncbi:cytochrome c550 [Bacillus cereus group sp. BfR-BA-01380]|uniref:cytochrome c550 n=1 Tax=Bacillus cereus group sp. BfR-BA-01380 TaxID=2920324 RepID=UPI001F5ACEF9|nr:cytochrome c [Bacillus cereus group sp. BfR-BA-01380]